MDRWNFAPELVVFLVLTATAIFVHRDRIRLAPALGGLSLVGFLYISPFCALGSALFTVRIVHDTLLAAVLAPLLVAALKLERVPIRGSLPVWTFVHASVFWLWHAPPLYEAAMRSDFVFWAMQTTITGSATVWWAKIVRSPAPAAASALLATMVVMGALGALLTFAHRAFYAPHWLTTQAWGMSPLEDQQLAGIIMWAPASLIYLLAALAVLYRALGVRATA